MAWTSHYFSVVLAPFLSHLFIGVTMLTLSSVFSGNAITVSTTKQWIIFIVMNTKYAWNPTLLLLSISCMVLCPILYVLPKTKRQKTPCVITLCACIDMYLRDTTLISVQLDDYCHQSTIIITRLYWFLPLHLTICSQNDRLIILPQTTPGWRINICGGSVLYPMLKSYRALYDSGS